MFKLFKILKGIFPHFILCCVTGEHTNVILLRVQANWAEQMLYIDI